jgi:hypothetical protein
VVASAAGPEQTQTPKPAVGRGLIVGQVVDATGAPISGALVSIGASAALPYPRTLTTAEGRFHFSDLPAGAFGLTAQKPGYAPGGFGRQRPGGPTQSLELADGERATAVRITMWKYGSITGRLTESGEPMVGVTVWSLVRSYSTGRSQFYDGPAGTTDDRGVFRFGNLMPGDYAICVIGTQSTMPAALVEGFAAARVAGRSEEFERAFEANVIGFGARVPSAGLRIGDAVLHTVGPYSSGLVPPAPGDDGEIRTYRTTCHPSAPGLKQAQILTLETGEDRTGADLELTLVRSAVIHGTVSGPDGPVANVGVRLAADFAEDLGAETTWESALSVSDARGRFTFLGVAPGAYTLRALRMPVAASHDEAGSGGPSPPTSERTLSANMPIEVGPGGIPDLTVRLSTGFRISGRFQFEGTRLKAPNVRNLFMVAQLADGHPIGYAPVLRGRTNPDGTFSTFDIPPGRYIVRPGGSYGGWSYKASLLRGRDVGVEPLDLESDVSELVIVFTDEPTEISGTVRDEQGRVDSTAGVVVIPADRAAWSNHGDSPRRMTYVRPSMTGRYRIPGLPPGAYLLAAVDDASAANWQNPRILDALARSAQRVTLEDKERTTVDLVSRSLR